MDYTLWDYNLTRYINAVGYNPGAWNIFVELPMSPLEVEKLDALLPTISRFRGIALITLEPLSGISEAQLPDEHLQVLACLLTRLHAYMPRPTVCRCPNAASLETPTPPTAAESYAICRPLLTSCASMRRLLSCAWWCALHTR